MNQIVVGIDRSACAMAALTFAVEEARLRQARLQVVYAVGYQLVGDLPIGPDLDGQLVAAGKAVLDDALASVDTSGVTVEPRLERGAASERLLDLARDASLLVVGSRGRGGFAGLLLGSTSQACAHHTPCPLVIVPG